jgi:hypothetical protein
MRTAFVVALALVLAAPASAARIAFLHHGSLVVLDPSSGTSRVLLRGLSDGPVRWSGDGRLVSVGGRIAGGPTLPATKLDWAPAGETAAYSTKRGAIALWSPDRGARTIVPASWGAVSFAWGSGGRLTIGRAVCRQPCGVPRHEEVWIWRAGRLRGVVGPLRTNVRPIAAGGTSDGRALWWADPDGSGSIAADGLVLSADTRPVTTTLLHSDFVVRCGPGLAYVTDRDRNTMHGKSIALDGRDVSRDRSRSWVSPSCSPDGSTLVAAAGRDDLDGPWGRERRAIWQLLPTKRQLTRPPAGWTDESPHVLADGSIVFVRTRYVEHAQTAVVQAALERLAGGRLTRLADLGETVDEGAVTPMYYGHYWWPDRLAVAG